MLKFFTMITVLVTLSCSMGCKHPLAKTKDLEFGMTPDEVMDVMGEADYSRGKVFDNEESTEFWEYLPPFFALNDSKAHLIFKNDRLVQWGQPGDFSTGGESAIRPYTEEE